MATVLGIGDTQLPFLHNDAPAFIDALVKKYNPDITVHIGDILDQYFANKWGISPKSKSTAEEFNLALEVLHEEILPLLKKSKIKMVIGNHDERIHKKADNAGIHELFLRDLHDIYKLPDNIPLGYNYLIDGVTYTHGHLTTCNERNAVEVLTYEHETPVVFGHFHTGAGVQYLANNKRLVWGMNLGCLIDRHEYAFHYQKPFRKKPILGCGIIKDGFPTYIPMLIGENHRWNGKLP